MIIGERLRALREQRSLSQGDIEKRTGLLRVYLSRVEVGHTVPSVATLEKLARAFDIPLTDFSTKTTSRQSWRICPNEFLLKMCCGEVAAKKIGS
jgi:transcriptional regulator with XRE-family HTH domain